MAKISRSQAFTKCVVYRDEESGRWMLEEVNKDDIQTFDFEQDILSRWEGVEGISLSIKQDRDYFPNEA